MKKLIIISALLLLISVIGYLAWVKILSEQETSIVPIENIDMESEEIKYLLASDFPDLSKPIVEVLQRRGCAIQQFTETHQLDNVISGEFVKKGQMDWAILCTQNPTSPKPTAAILVFWDGSINNLSEIPSYNGHQILIVSKKMIDTYNNWYGDTTIPSIDHDGIEDSFDGNSNIHYYYKGKWIEFAGSD